MSISILRRAALAGCLVVPFTCVALEAQSVVVARGGAAGAGPFIQHALPISDDALRALVAKYQPDLAADTAEVTSLTIVVDNDNAYVNSAVRPLRVLKPDDSSGGNGVLVRRIDPGMAGVIVGRGSAVMVVGGRGAGGGIMSSLGILPGDIDTIYIKRYEAGVIAKGQLMVTMIKLK
jgi:hypothetical protein